MPNYGEHSSPYSCGREIVVTNSAQLLAGLGRGDSAIGGFEEAAGKWGTFRRAYGAVMK
jgi:hypothetical protein